MTKKEIIHQLMKNAKIESYPKLTGGGGQSCGVIPRGIKLTCSETNFEMAINNYRSQFENRTLCITLFNLYLEEIVKP